MQNIPRTEDIRLKIPLPRPPDARHGGHVKNHIHARAGLLHCGGVGEIAPHQLGSGSFQSRRRTTHQGAYLIAPGKQLLGDVPPQKSAAASYKR